MFFLMKLVMKWMMMTLMRMLYNLRNTRNTRNNCDHCEKIFSKFNTLNVHKQNVHLSINQCHICDIKLGSKFQFQVISIIACRLVCRNMTVSSRFDDTLGLCNQDGSRTQRTCRRGSCSVTLTHPPTPLNLTLY